jgi:hypothetical protein
MRLLLFVALTLAATSATAQPDKRVADLPAGASGMNGETGPFTLYSLRDGRIVVAPDATTRTDSASTAWDIGFHGTTVIVNGGTSGPGQGRAVLLHTPYEAVTAPPPDSLLLADGQRPCPRGDAYAVCTGSENGWYRYAGSGVIEPLPDRTLVVRLAEGGFAKVRFLGYGMAGAGVASRRYAFEYALLPPHIR